MSRAPSGDLQGGGSVVYVPPDGGHGALIYDISGFDEPPPRFPRLEVRLRSVPAAAWPFLIVAIALIAWRVQAAWFAGYASVDWALMTSIGVAALLPAALLIGCPRAWRLAPAVFVGVVAWVWVAAALALPIEIWQRIGPEGLPDAVTYWLGVVRDLAVVPSLAGPALIAFGLSSRRRTATTWPRAMVVVAFSIAAFWGLSEAKGMLDFYGSTNIAIDAAAFGLTNRQIVYAITSLVRPIEMLGIGAMAWSSLSALRAGEPHRRFWAPAFAGSTMLFCVAVYSNIVATTFSVSGPNEFVIAVYTAFSGVAGGAQVLGFVALIVAFALGLPPDPLDLGDVVAAE